MKFTDEAFKKLVAALERRLPDKKLGNCSICGTVKWEFQDVFVAVKASTSLSSKDTGEARRAIQAPDDKLIPCAVLTCTNCGNTHFLNLNALGLAELYATEIQESSPAAKTAEP